MKKIWKPLLLIVVAGIMGADLFFDYRAYQAVGTVQAEREAAGDLSVADLPVGTQMGDLAPDFTGITLDGDEVRLLDLRGKTVLVNIFASWCGPCRLEAPHLAEAYKSLDTDEFIFVGLNLQETPDAVAGFQREFGIEFPLVLNQDGALTELYRPIGLPTSWVIDQHGVVRYVHAGAVTTDFLLRALKDVQAGRQPDPFATTG
jgi:thiol-disulfide isomerase/thioredoxin